MSPGLAVAIFVLALVGLRFQAWRAVLCLRSQSVRVDLETPADQTQVPAELEDALFELKKLGFRLLGAHSEKIPLAPERLFVDAVHEQEPVIASLTVGPDEQEHLVFVTESEKGFVVTANYKRPAREVPGHYLSGSIDGAAAERLFKVHLRRVLTEEDAAWLNLDQSFPLWWKDTGFFWRTERNGAVEIELRKPDGSLAASWVKPGAGFNLLAGFDAATKTLFFSGGPNPTRSQVFKVVDGAAPEAVSVKGDSVMATLTGDGKFLATFSESLDAMSSFAVLELASQKGTLVPSVGVEPKFKPNGEVLQLPDDGAWAMVLRPQAFVKGKKYPVILQVYGGPHHLEVNHAMRENLLLQWLADQGFVVVKLDGRGTPRRTRAYERAIARDFATTTVADQLNGLTALGKKFPELDLTRVGVYGWSFGGYMASLLTLSKGDTFKSGIAGAPVVDWLDYDTHYTERYLGLPDAQPKAYEVSSVLSYVKDAKRPLLLIHGTADDNVYFLHSLKLSDALFKAGKPHAVLPLTNFTHMVADPIVTERLYERIATWFKETL